MKQRRYNVLIYNMNTIETNRINGIEQFSRRHKWNLTFESVNGFGLDLAHKWTGDGVIALFEDKKVHANELRALQRRGIPVVDVVNFLDRLPRAKVVADNREIGRLAAQHFNERRHSHALYVCNVRNAVSNARGEGFGEAWKGKNYTTLAIGEDFSQRVLRDYQSLMQKLGAIIEAQPKPLAVFTFNDFVAVHVLNACRHMGIAVPHEVSILGTDDNQLLCENQNCPLSSVRHDLFTIGYRAAEMLQGMMDHPRARFPPAVIVPPLGVKIRRSTEYVAVTNPIVNEACNYMLAHIKRSFGAEQIANALGVPRYLLDSQFKQEIGHSIKTELMQMRLSAAKKRLRETDDKLNVIARECGFCHASYFERIFKREFSITPHQFRKQEQKTA